MKPARTQTEHPRERGGILAFTGMALLTLIGMTVVGVDLGRLAWSATEVQTVAEVAATAYAHEAVRRSVASPPDPNAWTGNDGVASTVIAGNRIDGQQASAVNVPASNYELGRYETDTDGPFVAGATPYNAVKATATATVNNFFASVFGAAQSTVTKTAVATLTCGSSGRTLPLAIQDCRFSGFDGPEDCADLPSLTAQGVQTDNACWTSLNSGNMNIVPFINQICGLSGQTAIPPPVHEGDILDVQEGTHNSACMALRDCYNNNVREFLVPIISCFDPTGNIQCAGNADPEILGFASIQLSAPPQCTTGSKLIFLNAFCNTDPTDGVGGDCDFGNFKVAMVE